MLDVPVGRSGRRWLARLLAIAAAGSAIACADGHPLTTEGGTGGLESYAAISMNGAPLPFTLWQNGDTAHLLEYETVRLYPAGTAVRQQWIRHVSDAADLSQREETQALFTIQRAADTVRLVPTCPMGAACTIPLDFVRDGATLRLTLSTQPLRVVTYLRGLPD